MMTPKQYVELQELRGWLMRLPADWSAEARAIDALLLEYNNAAARINTLRSLLYEARRDWIREGRYATATEERKRMDFCARVDAEIARL